MDVTSVAIVQHCISYRLDMDSVLNQEMVGSGRKFTTLIQKFSFLGSLFFRRNITEPV